MCSLGQLLSDNLIIRIVDQYLFVQNIFFGQRVEERSFADVKIFLESLGYNTLLLFVQNKTCLFRPRR